MSTDERDREILKRLKDQERADRAAPTEADMDTLGALAALGGPLVVLCRITALIAVGASLLQLYLVMTDAISAPQQTAGAALAIAIAVIPFVLVRLLESFRRQR